MGKETKQKIPPQIYEELVETYGKEKADSIMGKNEIDFRLLTMRMIGSRFKHRYGISLWFIIIFTALIWLILKLI